MKKILGFWVPLLGPAFLFACTCWMFKLLYAEIAVLTIVTGSIGFIIGQIILYKLLKNKIPDIVMRTNIPMDYIAAFSGIYLSGILSPVETCCFLVIVGVAVIIGVGFIFQGIKK